MQPALAPGDEVVATDSRAPLIGDVVVLEHPERRGFWLIKRMVRPPGPVPPGTAWVASDNRAVSTVDSSRLGPIEVRRLRPVVERLDATTFVEACLMLADEDEALRAVVHADGIPEFWSRKPGFPTLTLLILEQQVSLESGAAMYRRLLDATGSVDPASVERVGVDGLRSIGVTRQKSSYLTDLARLVATGELPIDELGEMPLSQARAILLGLRGVGMWTADAYLLSSLRHIDVFPIGDRALQVGAGEVLGMTGPPSAGELETLSLPWRPVRAAAARLIWHAYLTRRGRAEPAPVHPAGEGA